jgi:hypothetical protein
MLDNTVDNSAGPVVDYWHQACGFVDLSLTGATNTTINATKPNSNNKWIRCEAIDCYEDFRIGTFTYGGPNEWIVESSGEAGGEFDESLSKPATCSPLVTNYKTQIIDCAGANVYSTLLDVPGAVHVGNTGVNFARTYTGAFWESGMASGDNGTVDPFTWWNYFGVQTINYEDFAWWETTGGGAENSFWPRLTGAATYTSSHDGLEITAEVTQFSISGDKVTLTAGWTGATVKYTINGDGELTYSNPITVASGDILAFWSEDGTHTEVSQTYLVNLGKLFTASGNSGGTLLNPSGNSGGTIIAWN